MKAVRNPSAKITNLVSNGEEVVAIMYDNNASTNENSIVLPHSSSKAASPLMDRSR